MENRQIFVIAFVIILVLIIIILNGNKIGKGQQFNDKMKLLLICLTMLVIVIIASFRKRDIGFLQDADCNFCEEEEEIIIPQVEILARVLFEAADQEGFNSFITFQFRLIDETPITTNEIIQIDIFVDGVQIERLTGILNQPFSTYQSVPFTTSHLIKNGSGKHMVQSSNASIIDQILVDNLVRDESTVEVAFSNYLVENQIASAGIVRFDVYVGGPGSETYSQQSMNPDNNDQICSSIRLRAIDSQGVGNPTGTVTYIAATEIGWFGAGPHNMYSEYNWTLNNGLNMNIVTQGTTSNQQFWSIFFPLQNQWILTKSNDFNALTSNNSNQSSNWDATNEGSQITITLSQPVTNLVLTFKDIDGTSAGILYDISPSANAWKQTLGGPSPNLFTLDANGITGFAPPIGDDNNTIVLVWFGPITTVSFKWNENGGLSLTPGDLYCEIPSDFNIVTP